MLRPFIYCIIISFQFWQSANAIRLAVHFRCAMWYIWTMKRIDEDIKTQQFKKVYLLYGEQAYLRNQYRDKLIKALIGDDDTMNYARFEGDGVDVAEVIGFADTMPFLSERRVVLIEDSGLFNSACDELAAYIPNIPDTTVVVFAETKADKRLKLYKAVKEHGYIAEFVELSDADLRRWILGYLARAGRKITERAMEVFMSRVGSDMLHIRNEMDKIISYTHGREAIYPEDVDAVIPVLIEDRIFAMLDAIMNARREEAIALYSDLLKLREPAAKVLFMIERQLRMLMHIKELAAERNSPDAIAGIIKEKPYSVRKALPQANRRSMTWLSAALASCADTDEAVKSGLMDAQIGVELLIIELSER